MPHASSQRCPPNRGKASFDRTGIFTNNLIVATGDFSGLTGGDIWAVTSETNASFLTSVGNLHLEGMEILPNTNTYGPWAGKILTGYARGTNLFTIDSNLNIATFQLGIESEDIHIITNQDFYFTDETDGLILKLSHTLLTNYVGDVLITQEGSIDPEFHPPMLFIVHWDPGTSSFLLHTIPTPDLFISANFEQGTFAPIDIPATAIPY